MGDITRHFYAPRPTPCSVTTRAAYTKCSWSCGVEGDADRWVVYQPQDGTIPWVRPLTEFAEKFSYVS